jgi:hypothetical protein
LGNFGVPPVQLFPEKKLRDKTEEVRERRTQQFLDEDEIARKKLRAIEDKLKKAR